MGVPTSQRIRKRNDFQKARYEGKHLSCKSFVLQYRFKQKQPIVNRLGVIASRRVGNAVKRNKGKRIIRELFRTHEPELSLSCDIVIILRSSFDRYSFEELKSHYLNACSTISKNLNSK